MVEQHGDLVFPGEGEVGEAVDEDACAFDFALGTGVEVVLFLLVMVWGGMGFGRKGGGLTPATAIELGELALDSRIVWFDFVERHCCC